MKRHFVIAVFTAGLCMAACACVHAADLVVYDDASRNGFDQNCSFNGLATDFDFANASPVHMGNASVRFTPEGYNAVSWCTPTTLSTTAYGGISFWVNGGAAGGQDLQLVFGLSGAAVAQVSLATLHGSALPANAWVKIDASFEAAPMQYSGSFDQFWIQSNTNTAQPNVYLDDVVLIGRASMADKIFANGFETAIFRGTNLAGMETPTFHTPVADSNYPVYDTRAIDYFASKHMTAFRFLFAWEGMQSALDGPIPAATSGAYRNYFDNYKRIVDYATNVQGIQVIIEPWQAAADGSLCGACWGGNLVGSAQVSTANFADFWGKMAAIFKDNPRVSFGLVNEPHDMSTMTWFSAAQAAITAIRNAGSTQTIYVPGNGYTAASGWTADYYDTAATPHSNAYGWLNANGPGQPIFDPANHIVAEVHTYLDASQGGLGDDITAVTAARDHVAVAVNEARAQGYKIYLGEIGFYAGNAQAPAAWADFVDYFNSNQDTLIGFTWFAGGMPDWWNDIHAAHFSISPTDDVNFSGDTINMQMIQNDF